MASTTGSPVAVGAADWITFHRDNARTGVAQGVARPGTLSVPWRANLDGAVYGQPLLVGGMVIAATEGDSVYGLSPADGHVLWHTSLGRPEPLASLPCGNINPLGITSTAAYDPVTGSLFVLAETLGKHHLLAALDPTTGGVRWARYAEPTTGSAPDSQQRGALTVAFGRVYVPYGGLAGDCGPYKGAVVSVPADGSGDLAAYIVPTTREAGIWTPGGPVVDEHGDLGIATGNSESTSAFDYGNAVVHLNPALAAVDYWAPTNWVALNRDDVDLGSATPVLLPGGRVFAIGKEGIGFLLDRQHLGHEGGELFAARACTAGFGTAAVAAGLLFVPCVDGLVALRVTGNRFDVAWRSPAVSTASPIVAGGAVWAVDGKGTLTAFDPATGTPRFTAPLGPVTRFGSPAAARGLVVAATGNQVVAFNLR